MILRDFTLAPIVQVGDNYPTTHRPLGAGRNIGQGPNFAAFDLRLARRFSFGPDGRRSVEGIAKVLTCSTGRISRASTMSSAS